MLTQVLCPLWYFAHVYSSHYECPGTVVTQILYYALTSQYFFWVWKLQNDKPSWSLLTHGWGRIFACTPRIEDYIQARVAVTLEHSGYRLIEANEHWASTPASSHKVFTWENFQTTLTFSKLWSKFDVEFCKYLPHTSNNQTMNVIWGYHKRMHL